MRHLNRTLFAFLFAVFFFTSAANALTPMEYKVKLLRVGVILSANDEGQVMEWFLDVNSGYPDLADRLIALLSNTRPKGNTTVLDAIMGKYRIVNHKLPSDYIAPPYSAEKVKEAYVKNWKDRNSSLYSSLALAVKNDYRQAFAYITSPYVR